ncbi:MAG: hypothetical protein JSR72_08965 [Proteobacteria bacterium]|nr:hypothetical protein [Pseudomonadota bacterium]
MTMASIDRPGHDWIAAWSRHCHRAIGATGIRRVSIDVFTGGAPISSYVIDHLWRLQGDEIRSLLHLSEPRGLAGTAVLMVERRDDLAPTQIHIKLSTAKQPIAVDPERASQRVLGTDFTYEDLCFWVPYARPGDADALCGPASDGRYHVLRHGDGENYEISLGFEPQSGALLDYVERDGDMVRKRWSVDASTRFGDIFSPTRLRVERDNGHFCSVMALRNIAFDVPLAADLLQPDALNELTPARYAEAVRRLEAPQLCP